MAEGEELGSNLLHVPQRSQIRRIFAVSRATVVAEGERLEKTLLEFDFGPSPKASGPTPMPLKFSPSAGTYLMGCRGTRKEYGALAI